MIPAITKKNLFMCVYNYYSNMYWCKILATV